MVLYREKHGLRSNFTLVEKQFVVKRIEDWDQLVDEMRKMLSQIRVFALTGDLGAGKTTLVQRFMSRQYDIHDVSSPTYALIQEYDSTPKVYHMDLYRLKSTDELWDLGMEDILLDDQAILLVEWPELLEEVLDVAFAKIGIQVISADERNVVLSVIQP